MLKWIQGGLSAVTGIAEPEYGSDYIHTVTDRVQGKQPFCETSREDFCWLKPDHTNVETCTFYFSDLTTGVVGFAQIIHSNIVGIHTQAQFTFRIFNSKKPEELNLWTSTKLEDFRIDGPNFYAKDLSLELNEEDNEYHFVSKVNAKSVVDLTVTRLTAGCKVGEDPSTYYGDNLEEPWGRMRHVFWPRNSIRGSIILTKPEPSEEEEEQEQPEETSKSIYEEQTITFGKEDKAYSMFVMAFQGMKPHHAAKAWNFMYFHSEKHTAVLMEFVTPKSYANTKVTIGILTSDTEVLAVTTNNEFKHVDSQLDSVGWNIPQSVSVEYDGFAPSVTDDQVASGDYKKVKASVGGSLQNLIERIDVMNEIPSFIKTIVSGVAGTKPYIYQYAEDGFTLQVDDQPLEHGIAWTEVTFISESDVITEEAYDEA